MKRQNRLLMFLGLAACFCAMPAARAQFTFDYQTNIINVVSNWVSGDEGFSGYTVGSNTYRNALIINSGGVLLNDGYGRMGYGVAASNNVAIVNGGVWSNSSILLVGRASAGNQLIVSNGGTVFSFAGELGNFSSSSNNVAVVAGSGSVWSMRSQLLVGAHGAGNQLVVTNGGTVFSLDGLLGYNNTNNVAIVAGNGATWENRRQLWVGYLGNTNTLNIGTGGSVIASNASVGFNAGADGNRINVTGGNLYVTNAPGTGTLNIRRGTVTATAGGSITANNLHISPTGFVALTSSKINISGVVTNKGTFTMMHSVGTFGSVVNSGAWIIDPTTNVFHGNFVTTESGYIIATAADVFIFTNDNSTAGTSSIAAPTARRSIPLTRSSCSTRRCRSRRISTRPG